MSLRSATRLPGLFLALVMTATAYQAEAQVFDFEHSHPHSLILDGQVRFHLGDDPDGKLGWAQPAFADSQWPLLRSDLPWSRQGYGDNGGFAWYRFKVIVPARSEHL